MMRYSPYFQTLYDEQEPVGNLGRGTHYSVLRATSWHSPNYSISPRAMHFDFAIIWDEDHDTRVIECVEEVYLNGLLSKFLMFGERKANFTAMLSDHFVGGMRDGELRENIKWIANNAVDGDHFNGYVTTMANPDLINAAAGDVDLYLKNIMMLWKLGGKIITTAGGVSQPVPHPITFT